MLCILGFLLALCLLYLLFYYAVVAGIIAIIVKAIKWIFK